VDSIEEESDRVHYEQFKTQALNLFRNALGSWMKSHVDSSEIARRFSRFVVLQNTLETFPLLYHWTQSSSIHPCDHTETRSKAALTLKIHRENTVQSVHVTLFPQKNKALTLLNPVDLCRNRKVLDRNGLRRELDIEKGSFSYAGFGCRRERSDEKSLFLVMKSGGNCTLEEKLRVASEYRNVKVLVLVDQQDIASEMESLSRNYALYAVVIDSKPGMELIESIESSGHEIRGELVMRSLLPRALVLDDRQRIRELGAFTSESPSMWTSIEDAVLFLSQSLLYERAVQSEMEAKVQNSDCVEIVRNESTALINAPQAITFPIAMSKQTYASLHAYFEIRCPYGTDVSCGEWDYVVPVRVSNGLRVDENASSVELLRVVTAYSRGTRGMVDVTPLLGYFNRKRELNGEFGTFVFDAASKYSYCVTLVLYFGRVPELVDAVNRRGNLDSLQQQEQQNVERLRHKIPLQVISLWNQSVPFDQHFNANQVSRRIHVSPKNLTAMGIAAYVTGHGFGQTAQNCAEFCGSTHEFTLKSGDSSAEQVGEGKLRISFDNAGTETGCSDLVRDLGVTPNQYGTWFYGRNGWCPGQVLPLHAAHGVISNAPKYAGLAKYTMVKRDEPGHQLLSNAAANVSVSGETIIPLSGMIELRYHAFVNGTEEYVPVKQMNSSIGFDPVMATHAYLVLYSNAPDHNVKVSKCEFDMAHASLSGSALVATWSVDRSVLQQNPWVFIHVLISSSGQSGADAGARVVELVRRAGDKQTRVEIGALLWNSAEVEARFTVLNGVGASLSTCVTTQRIAFYKQRHAMTSWMVFLGIVALVGACSCGMVWFVRNRQSHYENNAPADQTETLLEQHDDTEVHTERPRRAQSDRRNLLSDASDDW